MHWVGPCLKTLKTKTKRQQQGLNQCWTSIVYYFIIYLLLLLYTIQISLNEDFASLDISRVLVYDDFLLLYILEHILDLYIIQEPSNPC